MRILFFTALSAVGLLAISTAILAKYNWNDKLAGQLISVAIVGTATAFVTVVLSLREVDDDWVFSTSVAIDQADGRPPRIESAELINRMMWRASALAQTSRSFPEHYENAPQAKSSHRDSAEPFNYVSELLQYQILNDLRLMQTGSGASLPVAKRGRGVTVFTTRLKKAKQLNDVRKVPATQWNSAVQSNRFAKSYANGPWDQIGYTVPEGVTLELTRSTSDSSDPPLHYVIRLARAGYFEFTITIYTGSANLGGVIPNGLQIEDVVARRCTMYMSDIRIHLHMEKLTSGGDLSAAYERWLREIAAEIEARWSDVRNTEQP